MAEKRVDFAWNDPGQFDTITRYDDLAGTDLVATTTYAYDENGNRTNAGYDTGDANRLLSDGTYDYEYDAEGNRTKKTEIATGDYVEYTWDHRNRLVSVASERRPM